MQNTLIFEIFDYFSATALSSARIAPAFFLLPFFNNNVLSAGIRIPLTMLVAFALWPHAPTERPPFDALVYLGLISREVTIGLLLASVIAWPFWVLHAVGSIVDNQRGATISSTIDPISGVDTSELANFFNLFAAVIFLQGGGMTLLLEVYEASYRFCDPLTECSPALLPLLSILTQLMVKALVLASPVIAALLMTEAILGLLSRFAPQLNAFSIALTIKGTVAFVIIMIYFSARLPDIIMQLSFHPDLLNIWFNQLLK